MRESLQGGQHLSQDIVCLNHFLIISLAIAEMLNDRTHQYLTKTSNFPSFRRINKTLITSFIVFNCNMLVSSHGLLLESNKNKDSNKRKQVQDNTLFSFNSNPFYCTMLFCSHGLLLEFTKKGSRERFLELKQCSFSKTARRIQSQMPVKRTEHPS